jgi:hypothetical protein
MHFCHDKESDNVNETLPHDFPVAAAGGDISSGPRGLDHYGQKLLAKRSEANRT